MSISAEELRSLVTLDSEAFLRECDDDATAARRSEAIQLLLVKQTLDYLARRVRYYRTAFRNEDRSHEDLSTLADLERFPITDKSALSRHTEEFIADASDANILRSTSGTTGRHVTLYGNAQEFEALQSVRRRDNCRARLDSTGTDLHLRVVPGPRRLHAASHTGSTDTLVLGYNTQQSIFQWFDYTDHLVQALRGSYYQRQSWRRVTSAHFTPPWMFQFITERLKEKAIDPASFELHFIALTGGFLTPRIRMLAKDNWKTELLTSFSCAEILGHCPSLPNRPDHYLCEPTQYSEVLDIDSLTPVDNQQHGLLCITSIYPFQHVMPLLRYVTGDIVEKVGYIGGRLLFRLIGRRNHCIQVGNRNFIGTADVLAALPVDNRVPQVPFPRFSLRLAEVSMLELNIESNDVGESAASELEGTITQNFRKGAGYTRDVAIKVNLCPKGTVTPNNLYPDR